MMIKKVLKYLSSYMQMKNFSKKNNCMILSHSASLKSRYGQQCRIDKGTYIGPNCSIGDYSYVNKNSSVENATIGKFCSISSGVYICPYEHGSAGITTSPCLSHKISQDKVIIGNDVLVSLNAIILSGVTIGDGAIIGAGAVVTHDVEPYEVVGGVPARHIKYRFSSEIIEKLMGSKWYDKSFDEIKQIEMSLLGDINEDCCS